MSDQTVVIWELKNLGVFATLAALWEAHPEGGQEGDFVYIGQSQQTGTKYRWNKYYRTWIDASTDVPPDIPDSSSDGSSDPDEPSPGTRSFILDGDLHVTGNLHVGEDADIEDDLKVGGKLKGVDLNNLSDVSVMSPAKNDILSWNGLSWGNVARAIFLAGYLKGTDLKTINGKSIVGSGNLDVKDGKSAYEIWLDLGNTGTKADFLASLQGNSGYQGAASELEVVNNCSDGGADKALSAEQGKLMANNNKVTREKVDKLYDLSGVFLSVGTWVSGKFYGGNGVLYESSGASATTADVSDYKGKTIVLHASSDRAMYCGFKDANGTNISNFQTTDGYAKVKVPANAETVYISDWVSDVPTSEVFAFQYDTYKDILPLRPEDISGFLDGEDLSVTFTDGVFYSQSGRVISSVSSSGNTLSAVSVEYGREYIIETPVSVPTSMYSNFFIFAVSSSVASIDSGDIASYVKPLGSPSSGIYQYLCRIPADCVTLYSAVSTSSKSMFRIFEAEKKVLHWLDLSVVSDEIAAAVADLAEDSKRKRLFDSIRRPITFASKRLVAFGDSITAGVSSPNFAVITDSYIKLFCDYASVGAFDNRAVSGSTIVPANSNDIYNKVLALTGTWDIIWIAGGTNDWNLGKAVGTWDDTGSSTFYGALKGICSFLSQNYPNATVIFVTPIPYTRDESNWPNHITDLDTYRTAIYDVATYYGYNVVNGNDLGMPRKLGGWNNTMCDDGDGCHPTAAGHRLYAKNLTTKLL